LGDEARGGSHWTLLFVDDTAAYYFDSYGVGPEDNLIKLAHEKGFTIWVNSAQVQGYYEEYCGIWALLAAVALNNAEPKKRVDALTEFVSQFKTV